MVIKFYLSIFWQKLRTARAGYVDEDDGGVEVAVPSGGIDHVKPFVLACVHRMAQEIKKEPSLIFCKVKLDTDLSLHKANVDLESKARTLQAPPCSCMT